MSILKKAIAAVVLSATVIGSASAFDLGTSRATREHQYRISGATGFTNSLDGLMKSDSTIITDNPCITTTLTTYKLTNGANTALPKDIYIWACEFNMGSSFVKDVNASLPAGDPGKINAGNLAEFYKADTGSGFGVRPFVPVAGVTVTFPIVANGNISTSLTDCAYNTGSKNYDCANVDTLANVENLGIDPDPVTFHTLDMGTSDVEPALFGYDGPPSKSAGSLIWGLPVSIDLRDALQANQFPTSSVCNPGNAAYNSTATVIGADGSTVVSVQDLNGASNVPANELPGNPVTNRESEACQPSLQREIVTSLLTGQITDWRRILNTKGELISATGATAGTLPRGNDYTVYVCRRGSSSGTQASYEAMYAKQRCTSNVSPITAPNLGDAVKGMDAFAAVTCPGMGAGCGAPAGDLFTPATRVFAGAGTGDVRECLTLHSQDPTNSNGDGTWAIGIFATENVADDTRVGDSAFGTMPVRRYRHIKVNGMIGSLLNAANGAYPYFSEVALQTNQTTSADPKAKSMAERNAMVLAFQTAVSTPSVLAGINSSFIHPWGQGGFMAAMDSAGQRYALSTYPLNAVEVQTTPLIPLIKHPLGTVNNCQEPVHAGGSQFIVATPESNATYSNARTDAELPPL